MITTVERTPVPEEPSEHLLWAVRRESKEVRAVLRHDSHGQELRILLGKSVVWTRYFLHDRDDEMAALACGVLADLLGCEWQRLER